MSLNLILSFWNDVVRWFDIIPKMVYFVLVSFMSVLDAMQFVIRKLIGLDVYYLGSGNAPQTGDIALAFLRSIFERESLFPGLKNAFWALVILAVILLVVTTIIAAIRQEYMPGQEESKAKDKNNRFYVISRSVKSLFLFLIVPVSAIFGLMLSNVFLIAIDKATSSSNVTSPLFSSSAAVSKLESVNVNGMSSYSFFDIFSGALPTNSVSFSGQMFKASAFTSSRIRLQEVYDDKTFYELIADGDLANFDIFNTANTPEEMAEMIDDAFANNIHFKAGTENILKLGPMKDTMDTKFWGVQGEYHVTNFSKFNVSLVWYYYNLWLFNYIVGFAFFVIAGKLFISIVLGLAKRIIEIVALFIISPPILAIMPLDEGKAFQSWRKAFIGRVLSGYGIILGMNLIFLILPYLQKIKFFPNGVMTYDFINLLISSVFIVLGLQLVEGFIGLLSKMFGLEDVTAAGGKLVAEVGETVKGAAMATAAVAGLAVGAVGTGAKFAGQAGGQVGKLAGKGISKAGKAFDDKVLHGKGSAFIDKTKANVKETYDKVSGKVKDIGADIKQFGRQVESIGFGKDLNKTADQASNDWERGGADESYNDLLNNDEQYNKDLDESYKKYQVHNGKKSKEDWLKDNVSKNARAKAESSYAERGMDRETFKNDKAMKQAYVSDRVENRRNQRITARRIAVSNAVINASGLKNIETVGEQYLNSMKDIFVQGGKGGFPAIVTMFNGGKVSDVTMGGLKKKVQKPQQVATKVQLEEQNKQKK